jgi:kynurenine formamidase
MVDSVATGNYYYKELGRRLSNWGRWGHDDELGTLNLITDAHRAAAAKLVRTGKVFDLGMPFDRNGPQQFGNPTRFDPIHLMTVLPRESTRPADMGFADDIIIMPLQCATQWDSLAHAGYDGLLYNGVPMTEVTVVGTSRNSIHMVVTGLLGRGVLVDIPALRGVDRLDAGEPITADDLEHAIQRQEVTVGTGDIVLVRTGWYQHYLAGDGRTYMQQEVPGLEISCCEWLHDREVAALASDTYCVEVKPSGQPIVTHPIHMILIRDLGMTLGEMFDLEQLAADCAADGRWEFLFTGTPLKLTGCVGSPVTPLAVK